MLSSQSKLIWPLVGGLCLILVVCSLAALSGCRPAKSDEIPPLDPQKADRMRQICVFPQTLHTDEALAVVRSPGSTVSHERRVPVIEEPFPSLVEVEAAIGKADLTDNGWMEWKENATDPANTNWYLRLGFGADKKLTKIAVRTSAKDPAGCQELQMGRTTSDWSQSAKTSVECGPDCR